MSCGSGAGSCTWCSVRTSRVPTIWAADSEVTSSLSGTNTMRMTSGCETSPCDSLRMSASGIAVDETDRDPWAGTALGAEHAHPDR